MLSNRGCPIDTVKSPQLKRHCKTNYTVIYQPTILGIQDREKIFCTDPKMSKGAEWGEARVQRKMNGSYSPLLIFPPLPRMPVLLPFSGCPPVDDSGGDSHPSRLSLYLTCVKRLYFGSVQKIRFPCPVYPGCNVW